MNDRTTRDDSIEPEEDLWEPLDMIDRLCIYGITAAIVLLIAIVVGSWE